MKSLSSQNSWIFSTKYLGFGFALLALSLFLQIQAGLDYSVQSLFFDKPSLKWWITETPSIRLYYYTFPKILIGIGAVILVFRKFRTNDSLKVKKIISFVFCMAFIPLVISFIKSKTNIHCPNDLSDYNGRVPFRTLLDFSTYREVLTKYGNGNCFPGGHASGGYAFMSTYFVLDETNKKNGILFGFLLGTYMALYQTFKGAHFLSHTLFTIGFSIVVISLVDSWLKRSEKNS
jgi:membrane-associated PAP2 superfamily phosphatase